MRKLFQILWAGALLLPCVGRSQTYESLYNWRFEGAQPTGRLVFTDDAYWGTTFAGGSSSTSVSSYAGLGTAFKLSRTGELTILKQFGAGGGLNPEGGLTLGIDGSFYGLAKFGGTGSQSPYSGGFGAVYKLTMAGATTTVFNLSGVSTTGGNPVGELLERAPGVFLGLNTKLGGNSSLLFEINPSPFSFLKRGEFFEFSAGTASSGLIKASDGNFYGSTRNALVRMNAADNAVSTLRTLTTFEQGSDYRGGVTQGADGRLYGAAEGGGSGNVGVLWSAALDGSDYKVLHHFALAEGSSPRCRLLLAPDGSLYGTTRLGGASNSGTLFKLSSTGEFTKLHDFSGSDGADPRTLILAGDRMAGVAASGGATGKGVIFEATFEGAVTVLKELGNPAGHIPSGPLHFASDGNAYGVLAWGGPAGNGAIYRRKPDGAIELVHALALGEGVHPQYALSEGGDGALYGVTVGAFGTPQGSLFRLNKDGSSFTVLRAFTLSGTSTFGAARGPLTPRADGKFIGMNWQGGSSDPVLFRVDAAGAYSEVHHFTAANLHAESGRIVLDEAASAWFIGFDPTANANAGGLALYKVTRKGVLNVVAKSPFSQLLAGPAQGADGAFYSVAAASIGGQSSLLKITPDGVVTSVPISVVGGGSLPTLRGDLVEREPGVFYVTSSNAGANALLDYRVHQLDATTGVLSELKAFPALGPDVRSGLTQFIATGPGGTAVPGGIFVDPSLSLGPDGHLYGSVPLDLKQAGGELFRINLPARTGAVPTAATGAATGIGVVTATLAGDATAAGIPSYGFVEFGPSDHYGFRSFPVALAGSAMPLSFSLAGLAPGTTYHYRIAAVSAGGTSYGVDQTFTTLPNATPVANADGVSIRLIGTPGARDIAVLANDSDPEGDALGIESYTQPTRGTLSVNGAGVFTYTPGSNFTANDSFSYTITDGFTTATALVTVTALPNQAPIAADDSGLLKGVGKSTIAVLANDSDADGDTFALTSFTQGSFGSVAQSGDSLVYTPGRFFKGSDSFTYKITDAQGLAATGNVVVRDPFLALKGSYSVLVGESGGLLKVTLSATGALSGSLKLPGLGSLVLKGSIGADGNFSQTILRRNLSSVVVQLHFDASQSAPTVTGSAQEGVSAPVVLGPGVVLATGLPPGVVAGRLTLRFAPRPGVDPRLDAEAWATGSVGKTGAVSLAGQMPDGTPFSLSASMQRDASVAIFKAGTGSAPSFYVKLSFHLQPGSDLTGTLHWTRPAVSQGFFLSAIDLTFDGTGSRFLPAPKLVRTLQFVPDALDGKARAEGMLSGGDLSPQQAADSRVLFVVSPADVLTPDQALNANQLNPLINRATGLLSGKFRHPGLAANKPPVSFKGVLVQKPVSGGGGNVGTARFVGPGQAGRVSLQPR